MHTAVLFDLNQKIIRYCSTSNNKYAKNVSDKSYLFHLIEI